MTTDVISQRADEILLKLLNAIDRDIDNNMLPSPHVAAYETLVSAEVSRRE